ncbi:MAG TPA: 4-alpha-glucanotransferase [Rhodocyclaceae bacterium]|nr:4-alpha-glucanotransferase [Rhodocyclaceae bacterium]
MKTPATKTPRASGILLHPSSLPGPFGSGDFGPDAYRFVDWLANSGQTLWQILPLAEIGPGNSPYMSCSAFAGNVLLIDLSDLASHGWLHADDLTPDSRFDAHRCDFSLLHPFRIERLRRAASRFFATNDAKQKADFAAFCAEEASWLEGYALFMAISQREGGRDWSDWPAPLAQRDAGALRETAAVLADEIGFWKFCQWRFYRQWGRLKHYANQHGIQIVGDMPIFVAYNSADVWANPDLFELDAQGRPSVVAGVPPDYFSETGQLWGNPVYRWTAHEQTGYRWWIARLRQIMKQSDLVRIDHFRGFAAYWEIPSSELTAINGRWVDGPGSKLFEAMRQAVGKLPIVAEDLGVVTPDVVALLKQFHFPGMRVLQFAFSNETDNPFLPHNYEANTVAYTGTHDNDTAIGWWENMLPRDRAFIQHFLGSDGHDIQWSMMRALSASVAQRVIFPLQDVLGLGGEHRMNYPGRPTGNWTWRFTWDQMQPWQGKTLAHISAVYGRCALEFAELPQ